jgi:preprotein translocase subunit SecE
MFAKIRNFFKEVVRELKKVHWPTKGETIKYTILVIFISILLAIYFGALDYIYTIILHKFIF